MITVVIRNLTTLFLVVSLGLYIIWNNNTDNISIAYYSLLSAIISIIFFSLNIMIANIKDIETILNRKK